MTIVEIVDSRRIYNDRSMFDSKRVSDVNEALLVVSLLSCDLFCLTNDFTLFNEANELSEQNDAETCSFEVWSLVIERVLHSH